MSLLQQIRVALSHNGVLADRVQAPAGSVLAYVLTSLAVAGALAIRMMLSAWLVGAQFITFFPAVMLSTLFFGAGAGLVAVALSIGVSAALLGAEALSAQEVDSLILFAGVALMDVWVVSALLAANAAARGGEAALLAANAAARDDEARFRELLESAPDATVIVDREHRITLVNAQAEALFGYGRAEMVGKPITLLIPVRFRAAHAEHIARYRARPRTVCPGWPRRRFGVERRPCPGHGLG